MHVSRQRRDIFARVQIDMRYAALLTLGLCVIGVVAYIHQQAPPGEYTQSSYWQSRISADGAKSAHATFDERVSKLSIADQHFAAHAFGSALYTEMGENGFPFCDQLFEAGCYHAFLARAILEHGLTHVGLLRDVCFKALGNALDTISCEHGIGHGILAYMGYATTSLERALETCATLQSASPVKGCLGGVFMEYDIQVMRDSASPVLFTGENVLGACSSVSNDLKPACFFWLNQWWGNHMKHGSFTESLDNFKKLGSYCERAATSTRLKDACYKGIGYWATPEADFDVTDTARLCEAASTSSHDRVSCWSVAAEALQGTLDTENETNLCEGLTGAALDECRERVTSAIGVLDESVWQL